MGYGFVYVLGNPSMPGIYKIGQTSRHPRARMQELDGVTSCPMPFELLAFFDHPDPVFAEQSIHSELHCYRVNNAREFFRLTYAQLQNVCRQWADPSMGAFYSACLDHRVDGEQGRFRRDIY